MTLYNPTLNDSPLGHSSSTKSQELKREFQRTRDMVQQLVGFVTEEHLSISIFRAFWRQEERATRTLRAVGQMLMLDLVEVANAVYEQLEQSEAMPLVEFQVSEAAYLFAMIDSIAPDEGSVGDGRAAAERFQYAVEARTALLRYALALLIQRYTPSFTDASLAETRAWLHAFSELLEEAREVVSGTQQLLWDEATAIQSHLDMIRSRFELLEEQAHAAAVIVRMNWPTLLEQVEGQLLKHLEQRQEELERLALGNLDDSKERGWLEAVGWQAARRAPVLGSLLLTVAGASTLSSLEHTVAKATLTVSSSLREEVGNVIGRARNFPVLARSHNVAPEALPSTTDEVARFFAVQPRPRGRQTLTIPDSDTLQRVLDELSRFGYRRRAVLGLYGMKSVSELVEPVTIDVRWGQGDRLLLLPPYRSSSDPVPVTSEAHPLPSGVPFPLIAQSFGFMEEQILSENPSITDLSALIEGQVIELPAQDWTSQRHAAGATISWGASLEQIARALHISVQRLADLNDIPNPDNWMYTGHKLRVPAAPLPSTAVEPEVVTSPAASTSIAGAIRFEGEVKPINSLIVHRVVEGDTLTSLATRYNTTVNLLVEDNHLTSDRLEAGTALLVRVSGRVVSILNQSDHPDIMHRTYDTGEVESGGSFPMGGRDAPAALAPIVPPGTEDKALALKYGATLFPSINEMPDDARSYFTTTVQAVADFFNVRPGDIIGILQAENNNAGLRIHQPEVSSAGARGVAQIVARTWNGWSNPEKDSHITDLRSIEQYGGLGFDWSMRDTWQAWKEGRSDGRALAYANADPDRFENSVAGIARHLVQWGLTRDRAESDPTWFQKQLADAISVYNSGEPLSVAENYTQSAANQKTTGQYVREAMAVAEVTPISLGQPVVAEPLRDEYRRLMDRTFGVGVSEAELARTVDSSAFATEVAAGRMSAEQAAQQLLEQTIQEYMAAGRAARDAGEPLPWPYVYDEQTLATQRLAVQILGRPLNTREVESLIAQTGGDQQAMRRSLSSRGDARLFAGAFRTFDELLKRSERNLPIQIHEVASVVRPAVAGYNPSAMDEQAVQAVMARVEQAIRQLPEYLQVNSGQGFSATPLSPMPRLVKSFGVPVTYQNGGKHTGIDIANPRVNGQEPPIFAVEDGTVVHVGPLYCDAPATCRGGNSIILDHGNTVYSIYSHNSAASVQVGERVSAGQAIGRQGDEGFSFGSHLHFEVHTGAPYSGDWRNPWYGGQFEDPMEWLP
ncbi:MAG: peptidoglycan DD-metalloendopeptidase family protein [Chloroflexota bacterium]|nr:peptidoglycan DD-metalloendopeptidase family protein [Chloroflexota bacterium]